MPSIIVDFDDLENVTADVILADDTLEIVPEGLKVSQLLLDLIDEGVSSVVSAGAEIFSYVSDGDTNGLLHFLGTNFGLIPWTNPHTAGYITVTRSSNGTGTAAHIVNRATEETFTNNVPDSYIAVDIGVGRTLVLNKYTLQNRNNNDQLLRNWKFQGSNDAASNSTTDLEAATWVDLDVHVNDTTIGAVNNQFASFDIVGTPDAYRWFRLLQNGVTSDGGHYLTIAEIELYGEFDYGEFVQDLSLPVYQDQSHIKPAIDDGSTPTTPGTPDGYIKFSIDGSYAWLPYYR